MTTQQRQQSARKWGGPSVTAALAALVVFFGVCQVYLSRYPQGYLTMRLTGRGDMLFVPGGPSYFGCYSTREKSSSSQYATIDYVAPFYIDKHPVTNRQYQAFLLATGGKPPAHWVDGACPKGQDEWPVWGVNGLCAEAYARWAGKRLPTEVEWEKAARGTIAQGSFVTTGRYYLQPWGFDYETSKTCYRAVGSDPKDVSPYGVRDMVTLGPQWTTTRFDPTNPNARTFPVLTAKGFEGCCSRDAVHRNMICIKAGLPVLIRCVADAPRI